MASAMVSKRLIGVTVVLFLASVAVIVRARARLANPSAESYAERAKPLDALWPMAPFAYRDQAGQTVTAASLKGHVWVTNFIFTQCRTVCPLLTTKMVQLQRKLKGVDVQFVSFSVDPEHDTPEVLSAYAARWAPDEPRWKLLATDAQTLPEFAKALHVAAEKSTDEVDPIIHSSVFMLVDADGMVRGAYDSEDRADFRSLEDGVRELLQEKPSLRALPMSPDALYHELSCVGCHERPELAPPLTGLRGATRELENGLLVTVDEAYVTESILSPAVKRVKGYPLRMPSYDGLIPLDRLQTLTQWVLDRQAPATQAEAVVETDPVCGMQVRVVADTPSATADGGVVHFCSAHCRERFLSGPQAFAR